MAQVVVVCRSCGFELPVGADTCPGCPPPVEPSLAARQVAGLALPTRSARPLDGVTPRPEHPVPPIGRARAARSAFSFTTALALLTFAAAGLAWLADQPRFVLEVPQGAHAALDDATHLLAAASVTGLLIGLGALLVWCVRATGRAVRRLARRRRRYA